MAACFKEVPRLSSTTQVKSFPHQTPAHQLVAGMAGMAGSSCQGKANALCPDYRPFLSKNQIKEFLVITASQTGSRPVFIIIKDQVDNEEIFRN